MTTTLTGLPTDHEQLCEWYGDWVRSLVRKAGVPPQDVDDVAQDILISEMTQQPKNVLEMYEANHISANTQKPVSFRSFLSARVMLRCRGKRETIQRRTGRELLICDTKAGGDTGDMRWIDLFGGAEWDDYSALDTREFIERMRAWLFRQPAPAAGNAPDLLALFDDLVRQVFESGDISAAATARHLGLTDSVLAASMAGLREAMSAAGDDLPAPEKYVIGGVPLTLIEIKQAISILEASGSNMVAQPLRQHKHPLASAEKGWYHPFSAEERKAYPDLAIEPGTHKKPADHVKRAVIHRLQRMLGAGMAVLPVPVQAGPPEPAAAALSTGEPEPVSLLEQIEARIFRIHGATAKDVDEILALVGVLTA